VRARRADVAIVALVAAWQVLERLLSPLVEGPPAVNVVCGAIMASALWWRRTDPVRGAAVVLVGGILSAVGGAPPSDVTASLLVIIWLGFSIGRQLDGRRRLATAAALGAGAGLIDVWDYGVEGFLFPLLAVGTAALIGGGLRDRATLTRELAERTHELDALREAGERDAVLDERRRIARELHDVVAHTVSIMVVQAPGARRQLDRDPDRARAALRQVRATGEDTLRELERLFGVLQAGGPSGGAAEVAALVARTRAAGLDVDLDVEGVPVPLAPGADAALYRVVQEALTNVVKHGGGAGAAVRLRWRPDGVELAVENGPRPAGAPAGLPSGGHGLAGMAERLRAHGGTLDAGRRGDGGFAVRAALPAATVPEVAA
jgi:signal transduction histidine kinase